MALSEPLAVRAERLGTSCTVPSPVTASESAIHPKERDQGIGPGILGSSPSSPRPPAAAGALGLFASEPDRGMRGLGSPAAGPPLQSVRRRDADPLRRAPPAADSVQVRAGSQTCGRTIQTVQASVSVCVIIPNQLVRLSRVERGEGKSALIGTSASAAAARGAMRARRTRTLGFHVNVVLTRKVLYWPGNFFSFRDS